MSTTQTEVDWLARVGELAELIEQEGPVSEEQGTLTEPLVEALVASGLFGMQVPVELGGGGSSLRDMLDVASQLVYHNASVGWNVLAVGVAAGNAAAMLPDDEVARRIFDGTPVPRMAAFGAPVGKATAVDGGYRLSGRFQFGSGIVQSSWVEVAAPEPSPDPAIDGLQVRGFVVPMAQVELRGNWNVYGLEATASQDFEITDAFVPAEHTYALDAARAVAVRGQRYRRLGIRPVSLLGNTAVAIGLARRALDEIAALAVRKGRPGRPRVADQQLFQYDFAFHDGAVRAVVARARELAALGEQLAEQGTASSLDAQRFGQLCVLAHRVSADAVRFAYEWGGTTALRRPSRLGRLLLDVSGATQHQGNDRNLMVDAAKAILG